MDTQDALVFTQVVSAGSLAGAARRLGITPMAATRRLASLEAHLGVRLLHRSTRALSLTPEGETFLPYAQSLLDSEAEALARLRSDKASATGLLRVSTTVAFGTRYVAPLVPRLLDRHPELRIALDLSDTMPDLIASGTDLAIRIARLRDSGLIARKLADNPRLLVASPDYLARHGHPAATADLAFHACLSLFGTSHWTFIADGVEKHVRVNSRFTASNVQGCRAAARAGGGITLLSEWNVAEDLANGRLVRVDLADAAPEAINIWAVYPTTRLLPQKVRVFITELRAALLADGMKVADGK